MTKQKQQTPQIVPRFYVYELADPRCGSVFYVGKGTGNRFKHHALEARAGRVTERAGCAA